MKSLVNTKEIQDQVSTLWEASKKKIQKGEDPIIELKLIKSLQSLIPEDTNIKMEGIITSEDLVDHSFDLLNGNNLRIGRKYANGQEMLLGDFIMFKRTLNGETNNYFGKLSFLKDQLKLVFVDYNPNTLKPVEENVYRDLGELPRLYYIGTPKYNRVMVSSDFYIVREVRDVSKEIRYVDNLYLHDHIVYSIAAEINDFKSGRVDIYQDIVDSDSRIMVTENGKPGKVRLLSDIIIREINRDYSQRPIEADIIL